MSTASITTTGSSTRDNNTFNKYKTALIDLREQLMKLNFNNKPTKPLNLGKFKTAHKISDSDFPTVLSELKIWEKSEKGNPREGTFAKWIYQQKTGASDEVDNELVQRVITLTRDKGKQYYVDLMAKKAAKPAISSATVTRAKFDPEAVDHQIKWIDELLKKEETMHGYMRPAELEMIIKIRSSLDSMLEFKTAFPKILEGFRSLNEKLNPIK